VITTAQPAENLRQRKNVTRVVNTRMQLLPIAAVLLRTKQHSPAKHRASTYITKGMPRCSQLAHGLHLLAMHPRAVLHGKRQQGLYPLHFPKQKLLHPEPCSAQPTQLPGLQHASWPIPRICSIIMRRNSMYVRDQATLVIANETNTIIMRSNSMRNPQIRLSWSLEKKSVP
jgi:hypothetical protein